MNLNVLWFILIGVLFTGYFVLEGFDFGVGIAIPILGRTDEERRIVINSIGPFWDANEVWFLTAGGAMFAAFPNWYATFFSGFYLALFLLLLALIGRGVAFEFRSKLDNAKWRSVWDWVLFAGSLLPPLLVGVAFSDFMKGLPIDSHMTYYGGLFGLLSPYSVLGGLSLVLLSLAHGSLFLSLRTTGSMQDRARRLGVYTGAIATACLFVYLVYSAFETTMFRNGLFSPGTIAIIGGLILLTTPFLLRAKKDGFAFGITAITLLFSTATIFLTLFPNVMISSLSPLYNLTIYNAASNHYSLLVMTIVALTLVPIVLLYQFWSYWVFRRRIKPADHLEY